MLTRSLCRPFQGDGSRSLAGNPDAKSGRTKYSVRYSNAGADIPAQRVCNEETKMSRISLKNTKTLTARVSFLPALRVLRGRLAQIPSSAFVAENASIANSRSAGEWAAETCTRMRALSFGTTGYEKPTT